MGFFSKWRTHKAVGERGTVDVSEKDGVRRLHLNGDTIQSAMRLTAPHRLELDYTRAMMGFLLFHPAPERILMIGLGGGSLAKFIHANLPATRIRVVEIHPQVVPIAHSLFFLPQPDARLEITLGDGAEVVREHAGTYDVLLVDGFEESQAEALATQDFYDDCAAALAENGVLAVNLWGSDKRFDSFLQRIETSFDGAVLCMHTRINSNIIVFAFKRNPGPLKWKKLRERARDLRAQYDLEFPDFVEALRGLNAHDDQYLKV